MKNVQINVSMPENWRTELEKLARIYSVDEKTMLSYLDLIRGAVQRKYELSSDE